MRLLEIEIRNYRVHREWKGSFEKNLNLIHGPNESGKSTLVEAIHRALFLKAKGNSAVHNAMKSYQGGDPTIELRFEAQGKSHRLRKVFSGNTGTITLEPENEAALSGDAAETRLAELLGFADAIGGHGANKALPRRWAHLWVWQGTSSDSPVHAITDTTEALQQNLQTLAGEDLLISPFDHRLIERIRQLHSEHFTSTGRPAKASPVSRTEERLEAARARLDEKREALRDLEQASLEYLESKKDYDRYEAAAHEARESLAAVEKSLKEVQRRRNLLKEQTDARRQHEDALARARKADSEIRRLENELQEAEKEAEPARKQLEERNSKAERLRAAAKKAAETRESAATAATRARAVEAALNAHLKLLETRKQLDDLQQERKKIRGIENQAEAARTALARLRNFTDDAFKRLKKKRREAEAARARLESYALRIKLLAADQPVHIGEDPLNQGEALTLTEQSELHVGDGVRIQLTPGGAKDLEQARDACSKTEQDFADALRQLGAADFDEAERKTWERKRETERLEGIEKQLAERNADAVSERIREMENNIGDLESRRDAPIPGDALPAFPEDTSEAREQAEQARAAREEAENREASATADEKAARQQAEQEERALTEAKEAHSRKAGNAEDIRKRISFEKEEWGETTARAEHLNQVEQKLEQTKAAEKEQLDALEKLGPEQIELDRKRLSETIEQSMDQAGNARESLASARTRLQSHGGADLEREVKESASECERIEKRLEAARDFANAVRYLLEKLDSAQNRTVATLGRPLEEKANLYLQDLFGAGTEVRVDWSSENATLAGFKIDRTRGESGYFSFDELSYGTREQAALALRLAMAEVLAEDHDGCLPIVLDDAFTHADSERIRNLRRVLYRGAERGLQLLILTCHPENYSGLTPAEIRLSPHSLRE
ncbi:MAG: AAA family ATPase [Opitutales bacterium]